MYAQQRRGWHTLPAKHELAHILVAAPRSRVDRQHSARTADRTSGCAALRCGILPAAILPRAHVGCWNIRIISLATIVGQIEMSKSEPTYAWLVTCAACSRSLDPSRWPLHAAEAKPAISSQSAAVVAVGRIESARRRLSAKQLRQRRRLHCVADPNPTKPKPG